jgi:CDGSH-type Zn-finger protein
MLVISRKVANAFVAKAFGRVARVNAALFSTEVPAESVPSGERFNKIIELESAKVVSPMELKAGEKVVLCRCWQSSTFPLCNGSHMKHNKATGDNLGMLINLTYVQFQIYILFPLKFMN